MLSNLKNIYLYLMILVLILNAMAQQVEENGPLDNSSGVISLEATHDLIWHHVEKLRLEPLIFVRNRSQKSFYPLTIVIDNPIFRKHRVFVVGRDGYYLHTCVVKPDSSVIFLSPSCVDEFNRIVLDENIRVDDFQSAYEVAFLFVRMVLPLISDRISFFVYELSHSDFNEFLRTPMRSEIEAVKKYISYTEYRKKFKKEVDTVGWFNKVSKEKEFYRVNLLTAVMVGRFVLDNPSCYRNRIINWEVNIYPNGTIKTELPEGIEILDLERFKY